MILKQCPLCDGDLYPHCGFEKDVFSHACDLVRCDRCKEVGSLDGRWWPTDYKKLSENSAFMNLLDVIAALRKDIEP